MHHRWLFVFRQDLRIKDNIGLYHAAQSCKELICLFVFDETVLTQSPAKDKRLGFLIDALVQLDKQLQALWGRLYVDKGEPTTIVPRWVKKHWCNAVFVNKSYGPRSKTRDPQIQSRCIEHDIVYKDFSDFLLVEPQSVEQRKVFTPYYKLWKKYLAQTDTDLVQWSYKLLQIKNIQSPHIKWNNDNFYDTIDAGENTHRPVDWAAKRLQYFNLAEYDETRNSLDSDWTTKLSPYLRFGLISVRELFHWGIVVHKNRHGKQASEIKNSYVSELAWREFWYHIMYYFPETAMTEFQEKRRHIQWSHNMELLEKWEMGETWYPIVDAAMKQLREENRMHGRARMIVASFLTKDMLIDWRLGEKVFAKYLLDYDFAVNMWNRQWSASVGADPKPLRIFNPILQSKRFDTQARYIKKYLPQLSDKPVEAIHDPLKQPLDYTQPIVDHYVMSRKSREVYKKQ